MSRAAGRAARGSGARGAALILLLAPAGLAAIPPAAAEPAIAVRTGYRCSQCHFNRTGGGLRTPFGSLYAQTALPHRLGGWREEGNLLPADPDARFAIGGDARFQALSVSTPGSGDTFSFEVPEANVYAEGRLLPGRIGIYLDASAGPGGSSARELFAMFELPVADGYVKAGKFLPPFGWRLPDDDAFIRRFSGFSYRAPDIGIEVGFEPGAWSAHLAAVNGASGGGEENRSKQLSLLAVRRFRTSRVGLSASNNIGGGVTTTQAGLLGGAVFGRLGILGEGIWRQDRSAERTKRRLTGYLEADLLVIRGLNVKLSHDWTDPDRNVPTDARVRDSLGVEYIPFPFLQLRLFARRLDGPPQATGARDRQFGLEAHVFF